MNHRELCREAARWLLSQPHTDLVNYELKVSSGVADVLGVESSGKDKRISIIECKRTRADFLADIKAKKMLKYEKSASHCFLAALPEVFLNKSDIEILQEIKTLGIPDKWGILIFRNNAFESIRSARRLRTPSYQECIKIVIRIAKNYMYQDLM